VRRVALLLVGAAVLVGCDWHHSTATTTGRHHDGPSARRPRVHRVLVTVVDGDTHRRVANARVRIGHRIAVSNRYGVAKIPLAQRAPLVTVASKRGYSTRAVRLAFPTHPKSTIRIYQPRLQWSMYGAGPRRSNAQAAIKLRPPFKLVWSRALGGLVEFPAVVADGIAYVGNARGTIRALDMRTGDIVWRHDTPHGKMASSPAVWGTTLVVHGMDGHVWVLRRSDGKLLWHYTARSPIESSPVVIGKGIDVFGAWNGTVTALDLRTHRVRWRRTFGCKITSSVAYADSTIYLGDYCGRLLALRAANGAERWSRAVNGRVYGTPAVSAGRVFVPSSTGGSLTAFSTGGRRLWSRSTGSYVYSSPAVAHGRVFFGSYNGVFYALLARNGRTLWTHRTGGPISGAAVVVDGVAYAGSFAHRILGVNAATGRVVLDFPHGEYVPVSGGGKRLLLHGYSRVFAVEAR